MSRWLLTVEGDCDLVRLRTLLRDLNVDGLDELDPIPSDGEQVVEVEGPRDLPERVKDVPGIRAVHPSSEMTLY